jgi:hypothetical protein
MKNFYTLLSAIVFTSLTANAQENLIINGDFENWTGTNPVNFNPAGTTVLYNDLLTKETTIVKEGLNSVKQVSKEQGTTQYLEYSNLIAVTPGTSYTISYWYLDNDTQARTRLWSTWLDSSNDALTTPTDVQANVQEQGYSVENPNWVRKLVTVVAPAGAAKLRYQVRTYSQDGASGGFIYFDALTLAEGTTAGVNDNEIAGLAMYPNPLSGNVLNIASENNAEKTVAIYNTLGAQVVNATVNNGTVNVSDLSAGIYIVKITEEGKTSTKKLVVK